MCYDTMAVSKDATSGTPIIPVGQVDGEAFNMILWMRKGYRAHATVQAPYSHRLYGSVHKEKLDVVGYNLHSYS
jgi:hypothetical protein